MGSLGDMQNRKKYLIYIGMCFLFAGFAVTRFWKLGSIPYGMHVDEVSMAYSAWSLANYGVDRYLKSWPVYLMNFDGGQSILYAYLCIPLFKIFGFSIWLVRVPAVLFSFLTLVFGIKIVRRIWPDDVFYHFFAGLLITLCPYFIMASRFGLDCNLMLGMSTVFLYCVIKAVQCGRSRDYLLAGVAGGLTLYTYALSYAIVPIFLMLLFLYVILVKKFSLKNWAIMAVPMALLAFPLIWVQLVNAFDWPEMHMGIFTITKMQKYRAAEFTRAKRVYLKQALNCLFGGDGFSYNMAPGYSTLYGISRYLFYIGLIGVFYDLLQSVRKKKISGLAIVFSWFCSILFLECHLIANVNKLNGIYFAYALVVTEGIRVLCGLLRRICSRTAVTWGLLGIFSCVYLGLFLDFANYYYGGEYTEETSPMRYFGYDLSEAVNFLEEAPDLKNDKTRIGGSGVFYAISTLQSPYELKFSEDPECFQEKYYCGEVEELEDGYNYVLWGDSLAFADELKGRGYTELLFDGYALYYR